MFARGELSKDFSAEAILNCHLSKPSATQSVDIFSGLLLLFQQYEHEEHRTIICISWKSIDCYDLGYDSHFEFFGRLSADIKTEIIPPSWFLLSAVLVNKKNPKQWSRRCLLCKPGVHRCRYRCGHSSMLLSSSRHVNSLGAACVGKTRKPAAAIYSYCALCRTFITARDN